MMKRNFVLITLVLLASLLFNLQDMVADTAVPADPTITTTADDILLSWALPHAEIAVVDNQTVVTMANLETIQEPGLPQLPTKSFLVALPAGAQPELIVEEVVDEERPYTHPFVIAPQPSGVVRNAVGEVIGGDFGPADPKLFDKPLAVLEKAGTMRGVRLARLTLYPVRPAGNVLQIAQQVELRIRLNAPVLQNRLAAPTELDAMTQLVADRVINPMHVVRQEPAARPTTPQVISGTGATAVIEVDQAGITAVTYADLAAIGFPVGSINPHKLHLTRDGVPLAIEWVGDGNAQFESGEKFLFYAQPWFNRWMNEDVYLLTAASSDGLRIASMEGSPTGLKTGVMTQRQLVEENKIYFSGCDGCALTLSGHDGDRWYWDDLRNPGRPSNSYPFTLNHVNTAQPATMTIWMVGFTDTLDANPDHKVDVVLNGTALGSVVWNGKTAVSQTFNIPAGILQTSNSLQLTLPGIASIDGILFDAFEIEYKRAGTQLPANAQAWFEGAATQHAYTIPMAATSDVRVYNVSNPDVPAKLNNVQINASQIRFGDATAGYHTYAIASSSSVHSAAKLRMAKPLSGAAGADYVIIAPAEFMAAATPLKALRQSQGMTVVVEDVQAIFDSFGYGRSTPQAIHNYLHNAYHTWSPAPEFVLLVGDGTNDPKLHKPDSRPTWIPPYLAAVDPWLGEIAADNRFVTVDGADSLPDMAIGRLPVNSLAEAQTVINKIVQYEANPHFGDWNSKVSFVTDNVDSAGNFPQSSDNLAAQYIADSWSASKNYYNPPPGASQSEKDALKNQVATAVRSEWNQGRGMIVYTGHSSEHQWAAERVFHLDDVAGLNNYGRLPVVLQLTCFTSSFQEPFWDTLDEALLRRANGGAVATWGPTGLGIATGHDALAEGFLETIITNGTPEIGRATLAGKLRLMTHAPTHADLLDTFTLLGDPATRYDFDFWPGYDTFLPVILRN